MQSTWYIYFVLFITVFLIYLPRKRKRQYIVNRIVTKNRKMYRNDDRRIIMKELAQRFIGKDVYIKLLEGNADGIVREVTDSGIILDNKGNLQVVNLDYVMKIREYPYKNGKRATLWGE